MTNDLKPISDKQKERELQRQIKEEVKNTILPKLMQMASSAIKSKAIPEHWMRKDNYLLMKAVMDCYCQERPYSMLDKAHQKEVDNLLKFI